MFGCLSAFLRQIALGILIPVALRAAFYFHPKLVVFVQNFCDLLLLRLDNFLQIVNVSSVSIVSVIEKVGVISEFLLLNLHISLLRRQKLALLLLLLHLYHNGLRRRDVQISVLTQILDHRLFEGRFLLLLQVGLYVIRVVQIELRNLVSWQFVAWFVHWI